LIILVVVLDIHDTGKQQDYHNPPTSFHCFVRP
jgi:hypothetical protein